MTVTTSAPDKAGSMTRDDLRNRTMRGLGWTMIARPATEFVLLGSMVLLARLVSPAEFGRFAVAALVSDLASIPANGIGADIVQRGHVGRRHLRSGFALTLVTGIALVALTMVASFVIVDPIFGARTAFLVRLAAPAALFSAFSAIPSGLLQRRLEFRRLALIDVSNSASRAGLSIGLALAGMGGVALVMGNLAGWAVVAVLASVWARPPLPRPYRKEVREITNYAFPASLAAISWVGFRNVDYAIVGARRGAAQAGLYFRAYTLGVEYQKKVSVMMGTVGFPVLSRARNSDEMHSVRREMVRLLTVVLFPMLALLAIVAPTLVPWMFGSSWSAAVEPTQILVIGGAATLVIDAAGATLMASGRARAMMAYGWGHFILYGCAVFLVTPLGLNAVAAAAAVVHGAMLLVAYALMLNQSGPAALRQLWLDVAPATLCCGVLTAVALPLSLALRSAHIPALPQLAAMALVGGAVYLVTIRVVSPQAWRMLVKVARLLPLRPRGLRRLAPSGSAATNEPAASAD